MIIGIVIIFLIVKFFKIGKNIVVLEIDEVSLFCICDYIQLSLFVIINIFCDQMDCYGEIYIIYKMILDVICKVFMVIVFLNGDSFFFYKLVILNFVQYFGFDLEKGLVQLVYYNIEGIFCFDC